MSALTMQALIDQVVEAELKKDYVRLRYGPPLGVFSAVGLERAAELMKLYGAINTLTAFEMAQSDLDDLVRLAAIYKGEGDPADPFAADGEEGELTDE